MRNIHLYFVNSHYGWAPRGAIVLAEKTDVCLWESSVIKSWNEYFDLVEKDAIS